MESSQHNLHELFRQLGLAAGTEDIDRFVARHRPLPPDIALADAPFWTGPQADFLVEETASDADWTELIDQLNLMLRD